MKSMQLLLSMLLFVAVMTSNVNKNIESSRVVGPLPRTTVAVPIKPTIPFMEKFKPLMAVPIEARFFRPVVAIPAPVVAQWKKLPQKKVDVQKLAVQTVVPSWEWKELFWSNVISLKLFLTIEMEKFSSIMNALQLEAPVTAPFNRLVCALLLASTTSWTFVAILVAMMMLFSSFRKYVQLALLKFIIITMENATYFASFAPDTPMVYFPTVDLEEKERNLKKWLKTSGDYWPFNFSLTQKWLDKEMKFDKFLREYPLPALEGEEAKYVYHPQPFYETCEINLPTESCWRRIGKSIFSFACFANVIYYSVCLAGVLKVLSLVGKFFSSVCFANIIVCLAGVLKVSILQVGKYGETIMRGENTITDLNNHVTALTQFEILYRRHMAYCQRANLNTGGVVVVDDNGVDNFAIWSAVALLVVVMVVVVAIALFFAFLWHRGSESEMAVAVAGEQYIGCAKFKANGTPDMRNGTNKVLFPRHTHPWLHRPLV